MAENTQRPGRRTIDYVYGDLLSTHALHQQREIESKDRTGISQIERVLSGEERPADVERDRERLRGLGALGPQAGPRTTLRVAAGSVVGKPTVDFRARDKVTGRAQYSVDTYLPGMLWAKVLRSPLPHATVASIDTSKAEAYPGVRAVITYKDVPTKVPRPALTGEPAFAGEPVAAVAADSAAIAEEALALIDVKFQQLPHVLDPREALKAGAAAVRNALKANAIRDPQFSYSRGDTAQGFAAADVTVEISVETSYEQHVALEPHNAVAVWDRDQLTIYSGTQYAHGVASAIAAELGMPQSAVHLLAHDTGGGFGDKTGRQAYHILTALLAKKTGRPVRWELSRKDIFVDTGHNYPLFASARLGVKKDGTITAIEGTSYIAGGAYGTVANADDWESATRTYRIPNVKVAGFAAFTNTVITAALRSVGEASGNFMTENLINKAAEAIDMDPLEFRLKNIVTDVDQVVNLPYSSNGLREAIMRGAELFNWQARWKGWKKGPFDLTRPQKGIGMMCFTCNKGAAGPPMTGLVQIQTDGSVLLNTGAADIGGGQGTTWSMIAAEAIGVPLSQVSIARMDTHAGPNTGIVAGSRGTKSVGLAMLAAAQDAKNKLLEGVAVKWKLPDTSDLDIKDGIVFRKSDPGNRDFQFTMAQAAASSVVIVDGQPQPVSGTLIGESRVPAPSGYSQKTFGAGFYEIEVDPGTGYVHVTEAVQVHDVGRAINPTGVINQIHGGVTQGMNKALTEELLYDPPTGVIMNPNLDDYKLHMLDALPDKVQVDFVEPYDHIGPFGAKGIGEPALLPASASIHAAIHDALGIYVDHQPMTPPRILDALRGA
ncbi:MAG TPA: xanthine dehydrogenase family protein molybdopterin-binding subunit [Dehalococcoidia bacterium]|nr:xanthine dehydrogenase family protein molybdopterin-binding subunit [Dehalococcoidia bacterium]